MLRAISLSVCAFTVVVALQFATQGIAAEASVSDVVEQARFWEKRERYDLANQAWSKVLRADPDNADALTALGAAAAYKGEKAKASSYAARLRKINPNHGGLQIINEALGQPVPAAADPDRPIAAARESSLARARRLANNQQKSQAVGEYRKHFGGKEPSGSVALEFYQTLGGTPGGWEEAREGLQRLSAVNSDAPRYQLAYAEHLTYREDSRREGIKLLSQLEREPAVAAKARGSRRQALVWLDAGRKDFSYYDAYLNDHPQDGAIKRRYAQVKRDFPAGGPRKYAARPYTLSDADQMTRDGFRALNAGELGKADETFQELRRKHPRDPNASGGLGLVELKRGNFSSSAKLLEEASSLRPAAADRWKSALSSARTWSSVQDAEAARKAGEPAKAIGHYESALARQPGEIAVRLSYADTLAEAGRQNDALTQYDRILEAEPAELAALKGKIYVLSRLNRAEEALAIAERIPAGQREGIAGLDSLKAYALRSAASDAMDAGDGRRAEYLLKQSLEADPESPYSRIMLADLYRQAGDVERARDLLSTLDVDQGNSPEALHIQALMMAEETRWLDGLRTLERVPSASRTADMYALQKRMWMRYEANRASALARRGDIEAAEQLLDRIDTVADRNAEMLGILANGYSDIGQSARAEGLLRGAMRETRNPEPSLRLQYASLLSQRGREDAFRSELATLRNQYDDLSVSERRALEQLEAGFAVQKADALRERGMLADAYEFLRPHLSADPTDADLNMALARLYVDFNEPADALDLYYDILERDNDNLKVYEGAIAAATRAGKHGEAEWMVKRAIERDPNNPRLYVLAGRMERAKGNDQRAASLFKQALALDSIRVSDGLGPVGSPSQYRSTPGRGNPFGHPAATVPRADVTPTASRLDYAFRRENAQVGPEARRYAAEAAAYRGYSQAPSYANPARDAYRGRLVGSDYYRPVDTDTEQTVERIPYSSGSPERSRDTRIAQRYDREIPDLEQSTPRSKPSERGQLIDEIATLQSERSSWLAGGLHLRYRDGQDGLGELTDIEVPLEFSLGEAGPGRLRFRAVPVTLDSGRISGFAAPNFGALALAEALGGTGSAASIAASDSQYDQSDNGVALGAVYELGNVRLDVGSTPLGFEEENVVGGIRWTPTFDDVLLSVDVARRSISDSLLSYAGSRDPFLDGLAGREVSFGGVTRNGVRVDVARDFGVNGVYGNLGGYFIEGELVEDNLNFELGGGYYHHLLRKPNSQLTVGVNLTTLFYEENLGAFTVGHGGYFSPQFYTAISLPIEWAGRADRLAYRVGGSIGIQAFDEDDADIFPGNFGGLQDRLAVAGGVNGRTSYEGDDSSGANIGFHAAAEYLLTPHFSLGGQTTFSNAKDYDELGAGAYIRYWFRPQTPSSMPRPRVLAPFYPGDPSW